jgi:hypothetical protein
LSLASGERDDNRQECNQKPCRITSGVHRGSTSLNGDKAATET